MSGFKLLAIATLAVPAIALAQVGPNPTVPGGSQSPAIGGSTDVMTAPQDAQVGSRATGNVLDRSVDTRTDTTTTTGSGAGVTRPGATTTPGVGATTDTDASATGTGTRMGTETRTKTRTKSMETRGR